MGSPAKRREIGRAEICADAGIAGGAGYCSRLHSKRKFSQAWLTAGSLEREQ